MTDTPHIWDIGEAIQIELFVGNPNTGAGVTGEVPNITLTIQRVDGNYWNGSSWVTGSSNLTMTEIDAVNQKGRYRFILPAAANTQEDRYVVHAIVNDPPLFNESEAYELHISKPASRFYESEPL